MNKILLFVLLIASFKIFADEIPLENPQESLQVINSIETSNKAHIVQKTTQDLTPFGMYNNADIVVKSIIIILLCASILSWSLFIAKKIDFAFKAKTLKKELTLLQTSNNLQILKKNISNDSFTNHILLQAQREIEISSNDKNLWDRILTLANHIKNRYKNNLSTGVNLLANIGSVSPFVGLFGTVWGIMNSFIGIAQTNTTNLAVVAPGIAEALLATALGLIAAIPAVIFYNVTIKNISNLNNLLTEILELTMLHIDREGISNGN